MSEAIEAVIAEQLKRLQSSNAVVNLVLSSLEQSVLGGILIKPELFYDVELSDADFADYRSRSVYRAITDLVMDGTAIDVVTVEAALSRQGTLDAVGGISYLGECAANVPTAFNTKEYAKQVKAASLARQVYGTLGDLIEVGRHHLLAGDELLNVAMSRLGAIQVGRADNTRSIGQLARERIQTIEQIAQERDEGAVVATVGAPTGVALLDAKTGGFPYGVLSILCARPGMGKSSAMLAAAAASSRAGIGVHVFSMEDSFAPYTDRALAQSAKVPLSALRFADLNREQVGAVIRSVTELQPLPWVVDDRPGLTSDEIIRSIQRRRISNKTRLAVVDYATLMRSASVGTKFRGSAQDMLKQAALSFQIASKEMDISILLVSQLNRGVESRDDRRPMMSDIRDAGELEEYSKFIVGLYRGFAYAQSNPRPQRGIDYDCLLCDQSLNNCNHEPSLEDWARQIHYLILKNANGPTGQIVAHWDGPTVSIW